MKSICFTNSNSTSPCAIHHSTRTKASSRPIRLRFAIQTKGPVQNRWIRLDLTSRFTRMVAKLRLSNKWLTKVFLLVNESSESIDQKKTSTNVNWNGNIQRSYSNSFKKGFILWCLVRRRAFVNSEPISLKRCAYWMWAKRNSAKVELWDGVWRGVFAMRSYKTSLISRYMWAMNLNNDWKHVSIPNAC